MVKCPKLAPEAQELYALRGKFNSLLEERIYEDNKELHRIMSIDVPLSKFDFMGNLSPHGKSIFWKEIIRGFKKFDLNEITLNAQKLQSSGLPARHQSDKPALIRHLENAKAMAKLQKRSKLPTPPK